MDLSWELLESLSNRHGQSFYILDSRRFVDNYKEFLSAFRDVYSNSFVGYSYKTNYTPRLCSLANSLGGYAEVVSEMEFDLAIRLGVDPRRIIFNGPYKSEASVSQCLLGGGMVNLDSLHELDVVESITRQHRDVEVALGVRCNFDIGSSLMSRFGLDVDGPDFRQACERLRHMENVTTKGLHCHFPDRAIETFASRIEGMLNLAEGAFGRPPDIINVGGGYFGKVDPFLGRQFDCEVPTYRDYAETIAGRMKDAYGNGHGGVHLPRLILEPGTGLVADTMCYVTRVVSVKEVRQKSIATVTGSRLNILPTSGRVNLPITVYSSPGSRCLVRRSERVDVAGYTCIEDDYLHRGYEGPIAKGDFVVVHGVGSYSVVMKPPFILPNCAVIEHDSKRRTLSIVKRREYSDDIFGTYVM